MVSNPMRRLNSAILQRARLEAARKAADRLYEQDFYLWTQAQAQALRALAAEGRDGPLDLARLAEEIEDLGNGQRRLVTGALARLVLHCLKLACAFAEGRQRGLLDSIDDARDEIAHRLTRSLRQTLEDELQDLYQTARKRVGGTLDARAGPGSLPDACPYTLDQLLANGWYPEPVSLLAERP